MDPDPPPLPPPSNRQNRHRKYVAVRPHRRRVGLRIRWTIFGAILGGVGVWLFGRFGEKVAEPPPPPDARLVGTWHSDADATIARLRPANDEEELKWRRKMFKTTLTYTADSITTQIGDGEPDTRPYRVIRKDAKGVTLRFYFAATERDEEVKITFEGSELERPTRYWVETTDPPSNECFNRIR
jgi:hypothetical protein